MAGVMVFFGLFLLTSVVFGMLTSFGMEDAPPTLSAARRQLHLIVVIEILDAALVAAALFTVARPLRRPALVQLPPALLWAGALAGVFALVAVNATYHEVLRLYLATQPARDAIVSAIGITPLVVFAYCIQPAIVEELFFRYLALDTLRGVMSVHQAVFISSLMFGMAHVGVPLSVPMLILVGVPLAYARVWSGGLALPMAMHFLHNAIIVLMD